MRPLGPCLPDGYYMPNGVENKKKKKFPYPPNSTNAKRFLKKNSFDTLEKGYVFQASSSSKDDSSYFFWHTSENDRELSLIPKKFLKFFHRKKDYYIKWIDNPNPPDANDSGILPYDWRFLSAIYKSRNSKVSVKEEGNNIPPFFLNQTHLAPYNLVFEPPNTNQGINMYQRIADNFTEPKISYKELFQSPHELGAWKQKYFLPTNDDDDDNNKPSQPKSKRQRKSQTLKNMNFFSDDPIPMDDPEPASSSMLGSTSVDQFLSNPNLSAEEKKYCQTLFDRTHTT